MYIHFTEYGNHNKYMQIQELGAQPKNFPVLQWQSSIFLMRKHMMNGIQRYMHVTSFFDRCMPSTETQEQLTWLICDY